jgi:hypothetical protein
VSLGPSFRAAVACGEVVVDGSRESRARRYPSVDLHAADNMGVAHDDSLTAVVAKLTAPPGFMPEPDPVFGDQDRTAQARIGFHGPFARDPAAIVVHKQRESDDRRLYAVGFDDLRGNWWFWLIAAQLGVEGWAAHGVAGGSDGPGGPERATIRPSSTGSSPWLNLCGQWGGDTFYAGGRLDGAGAAIGRVQLTLSDGSQLQDDGVGDVSLFIGRHGQPPVRVEIFAPDGALLSKRDAS